MKALTARVKATLCLTHLGSKKSATRTQVSRIRTLTQGASVLSLIAIAVVGPVVLHADDQSAGQSSQAGLEEIVVTARRREENVQSVPIAITVLSQEALKQNNVQTFENLQYVVPALSVDHSTQAGNYLNLSIRGQGTNGTAGLEGVVAYLNEVPIPDIQGLFVGGPGLLFDLENVQVLQGPQGTLFGRNSVGGDLLLQSARPTNEFGGHVQVGYGNYDNRELDAAINLPIVPDVLLVRLAVNAQYRDGYIHILGTPTHPDGTDGNNRDTKGIRGSVMFRPVDWLQNDTTATFTNFKSRFIQGVLSEINPAGGLFYNPGLPALLAEQQAFGVRTVLPTNVDDVSNGDTLTVTNKTSISLNDNIQIKNIFGYAEVRQIYAMDADTTPLVLVSLPSTPRDTTIKQYTDELQLVGKSFDKLDWIVGAFYMEQPLQPDFVLFTVATSLAPLDSLNKYAQKSKAVFAQGTYDLSAIAPGLKFTAGTRYTEDYRQQITRGGFFGSSCTGPAQANCGTGTEDNASSNSHAVTYTVGPDYEIAKNTFVYATVSRGYRAGGFNQEDFATAAREPPFGPEFVTNYELGIKSDWNAGSVQGRTNASIWAENYTDIQTQSVAGGFPLTVNGGTAKLWGVELQSSAKLNSYLKLGANFNYLHYKWGTFNPGVTGIDDLLASTLLNRPAYKYGVNATYTLPYFKSLGDMSAQANWNWQSKQGDTSIPLGMAPAFGILNMVGDWKGIGGSSVDLQLYASNVLNKTYVTQPAFAYEYPFGYDTQTYGEPRMYGVRVNYHF
jgi:iron complex outermembrane receptor protein